MLENKDIVLFVSVIGEEIDRKMDQSARIFDLERKLDYVLDHAHFPSMGSTSVGCRNLVSFKRHLDGVPLN